MVRPSPPPCVWCHGVCIVGKILPSIGGKGKGGFLGMVLRWTRTLPDGRKYPARTGVFNPHYGPIKIKRRSKAGTATVSPESTAASRFLRKAKASQALTAMLNGNSG